MKQQEELNKQQEEVNKQQGNFARQQEEVNKVQRDSAQQYEEVAKQQDTRIRELEETQPKFEKVTPELDVLTPSINKATVKGNEISANGGIVEYHPFFLTRRLQGREVFELEILAVGAYYFLIGIAADTLRKGGSCYSNDDSLALQFNKGKTYLHSEGKCTDVTASVSITPQDGYKIRVKVDRLGQEVEWSLSHPFVHRLFKAMIPVGMRSKTLLPVVHLYCHCKNVVRFV